MSSVGWIQSSNANSKCRCRLNLLWFVSICLTVVLYISCKCWTRGVIFSSRVKLLPLTSVLSSHFLFVFCLPYFLFLSLPQNWSMGVWDQFDSVDDAAMTLWGSVFSVGNLKFFSLEFSGTYSAVRLYRVFRSYILATWKASCQCPIVWKMTQ